MNPAALTGALARRTELPVSRLMDSTLTPEDVELVQTPAVSDIIIDVRHPDEGDRSPLTLTNNKVIRIPFYELNRQMPDLPRDCQYLLYCDRGTMSRMHAGHLKAGGHENVKVYAPGH